jgi:HEAT repeat protein
MFTTRHHRRVTIIGLLLLGGIAGWTGYAQAQLPNDPVDELSQALKVPVIDVGQNTGELRAREAILTRLINKLRTVSDLRRALVLDDWLDKDQDINVRPEAKLDQKIRSEVAARYIDAIRASLASNQPLRQAATADLLSDLGIGLRGVPSQGGNFRAGLNSVFGPDLARLLKNGNPRVEVSAARALGQINPDPKVAVPALATLLKSGTVEARRAACAGLGNLVKNMTPIVAGKAKGVSAVAISPDELVTMAAAVAPSVAVGLEDADAEVRRLSAEGLLQASAALSDLIGQPKIFRPFSQDRPLTPDERAELEALRRELAQERARVAPLATTLSAQAPKLARAMRDPDEQTRLMVRKALEEMGNAYQRLERREASIAGLNGSGKTGQGGREEESSQPQAQHPPVPGVPLTRAFDENIRILVLGLQDPDLAIRLATIDVLEMFGYVARSGAPALVKALRDPNRFVRWAAARTLGKMAPTAPELVVPGLASLLNDRDLDLRIQAANSLGLYGPEARAAVPMLTQTVSRGDGEIRRAAMMALAAIGPDNSRAAIPAITGELTHHNPQVRQAAAQVLGRFGPAARSAEPALMERAEVDSDIDVRKAASDALLDILPAPRER